MHTVSITDRPPVVIPLRVHPAIRRVLPRRPDLLIFNNGIPVTICEFKRKFCFLSVISDGAIAKLGTVFIPYTYYYAWNKANDINKVSNGISSLLNMIAGAFAPERILQILCDYKICGVITLYVGFQEARRYLR